MTSAEGPESDSIDEAGDVFDFPNASKEIDLDTRTEGKTNRGLDARGDDLFGFLR